MSDYLHVDVSCTGHSYPFWIKRDGEILAHTQLCRSRQEVAVVLRNYLRGLWRKGHITGKEKLIINEPVVAETWDLNRFRARYLQWVEEVAMGQVSFRELQ